MKSRFSKKEQDAILTLAQNYLTAVQFRGHLDEQHNDSNAFPDIPVWELKAALLAAYEMGKNSK